jgi:hypothetical protein
MGIIKAKGQEIAAALAALRAIKVSAPTSQEE